MTPKEIKSIKPGEVGVLFLYPIHGPTDDAYTAAFFRVRMLQNMVNVQDMEAISKHAADLANSGRPYIALPCGRDVPLPGTKLDENELGDAAQQKKNTGLILPGLPRGKLQ